MQSKPRERAARQSEIRAILRARQDLRVRSQDELAELLKQRGFDTTQTTLSRDLRALGVVKTPDGYAMPESVDASTAADSALQDTLSRWLISATPAQNQVVLRTPPGGAQAVGLALDRRATTDADIVGTIAGDDTVLVICPDARTATRLSRRLIAVRS